MRDDEVYCSYCGTVNRLIDGEASCKCEFCGKEVFQIKKGPLEIYTESKQIVSETDSDSSNEVSSSEMTKESSASSETEIDRLFELAKNQYINEKKSSFKFTKKTITIAIAVFIFLFLITMIMVFMYFSRMSDAIMQNTFYVMSDSEEFYNGEVYE